MTRPRQNFPKISTRCHRCCQRPNCKYQLNWISKCQPVFPMPYDKCAKLSPRQTANFDCSTGLHNDLIASPMSCHCNSHYHAIAVPSPFYWVKEGKMASSQLLTSWKSRIRTFSNDRQLYSQASHLMHFCTRHFHLSNEGHPVISRFFTAIFTISLLLLSRNCQNIAIVIATPSHCHTFVDRPLCLATIANNVDRRHKADAQLPFQAETMLPEMAKSK